jgi:hypothetical protein
MAPECFIDKLDGEVAASDADDDEIVEVLSGGSHPVTGSDFLAEIFDLAEDSVDVGENIFEFWVAEIVELAVLRRPQDGVQHGSIFCKIDMFLARLTGTPLNSPLTFCRSSYFSATDPRYFSTVSTVIF